MIDEYNSLKEAIEAAGYFTTFQPIEEPGDRIVCASLRGEWGLGGRSFWVAVRKSRWFIATWVPYIYEIPNTEDVPQLVLEVLTNNDSRCYDINAEIQERFGLLEVTDDQFDAL